MTLGLTKGYTPSTGDVANDSLYNTDLAAIFNTFAGLEADTPTSSMSNFAVDATGKIYLDGGGNTYIIESSSDTFKVFCGGSEAISINTSRTYPAGDLFLTATKKIFLDGGGNTYIYESSGDVMRFYTNDLLRFEIGATGVVAPFYDVALQATKKLFLDGGTDTYIYESSANVIQMYTGDNVRLELNSTTGGTGGTGSAGAGKQYVELKIGGSRYKLLHDGTL